MAEIKTIFEYAAYEEQLFERMASETGYQRITTFYSDLSIAEVYGASAIKDTYKNVCENWINDYKFFTEFVMCLNWKSWEMDKRKNLQLTQLYVDLYRKADELFYQHYANDEVAKTYYFDVTD